MKQKEKRGDFDEMRLIRCVFFCCSHLLCDFFVEIKEVPAVSSILVGENDPTPHSFPPLVCLSLLVDSVVVIQLVPDVSGGTKLEKKRVEMKLVRKKKGVAAHS